MNANTTTSSNESAGNNSGKLPCKNSLNFLADVGVMQRPTTEARNQGQLAAFIIGSVQPASLLNLHPGPYPSTQSQVVQFNRELATEDAGPSVVKCSQARKPKMSTKLMFNKQKRAALTPEGVYAASVTAISVIPKKGTEEPETIEVRFALNALNQHVTRPYPAKLGGRSPLLRDAKIILGRNQTRDEEEHGFDLDVLKDRPCRLSISHRPGPDGKPQRQFISVMAPETSTAAPAAAEVVAAVAA
jgi:hypothetical protein